VELTENKEIRIGERKIKTERGLPQRLEIGGVVVVTVA
jgi:hypothetical protein